VERLLLDDEGADGCVGGADVCVGTADGDDSSTPLDFGPR
jgi:hypothetical protein